MSGSKNIQYLLVGNRFVKLKGMEMLACKKCGLDVLEGQEIYSKRCSRGKKKIYHLECARSVNLV